MSVGGRNSPKKIHHAERQRQALELRMAGASYPAIASRLGYATSYGAQKAVEAALAKAPNDAAPVVRQMECDRLDRLMLPWWSLATRTPPDKDAVEIVLKLMTRRAKLCGLDAPKSVEVSGKDGAAIPIQVIEVVRAAAKEGEEKQ